MEHKLDMDYVIKTLCEKQKAFIQAIRKDTSQIKVEVETLVGHGWSGDAADTFREFYDEMDAAHKAMADSVEEWDNKLYACWSPSGQEAVSSACNGILSQLNGGGSTTKAHLEYNDDTEENPSTMSNQYYQECQDIIRRLENVERRAASLNYYSFDIASLQTRIENYAQGFVEFGNAYAKATRTYDNFIDGTLNKNLQAGVQALSKARKALQKLKPPKGEGPHDPVYRAIQFTENVIMKLPLGDANNNYRNDLCYYNLHHVQNRNWREDITCERATNFIQMLILEGHNDGLIA